MESTKEREVDDEMYRFCSITNTHNGGDEITCSQNLCSFLDIISKCEEEDVASIVQKMKKIEFFEKFDFWSSEALNFTFGMFFQSLFTFAVTRRAGCSHLNSKSNTVSGKI